MTRTGRRDRVLKSVQKDRNFLNHLRMRAAHMHITNGEVEDLITHARKIIEMIDKEMLR